MKYPVIILLCIIFCGSCKKDKDGFSCESIPKNDSPFGWNYINDPLDSNYISLAGINPTNGTELLFYARGSNGKSKLCKYNILSNDATLLAEDNVTYSPSWGRNGWILYGLVNGTIWKIKSNGDSLAQIQGISSAFHPTWNFSSDRFTVFRSDLPIAKQTLLHEYTTSGVVDTFTNLTGTNLVFNSDSVIYFSMFERIYVYYTTTKTQSAIFEIPPNSNAGIGLVAPVAGKLIYTAIGSNEWGGLFSLNPNTGENKRIVSACTATQYGSVMYSPQLDKLFMTVAKYYDANFDQNTIKVKKYIVMMNADCTNEERLPISIP